ncbi:TBC1 domain family member 2A [Anas platyrhynchos]|uniref:TBC1 domain family member 2 n=2 Tax=Anas TaxID=8835 RepID=A0A493U0F6_ANAPP|nr:TBC1 domain family member 2A [Anas platyrhynchos]XP_038026384.1 TBC1 domain family member 2A [Anas platyrhynchos]XP_038026385.1 TBC1 domain family member 2A [Anas platyrhynchos]XP_038026386.1 TBC1 domain family member 2A [Anas platyrhynchos]XP_038026387.1 TBC1 domain family member 2A [Anas platyrhynchos]XP_038026388.1 TBC1 domain family member 2A [Anas platyrhynchos]XP_038026389.1 TBC1 domain family member 2A [Anas platyrhynchos]
MKKGPESGTWPLAGVPGKLAESNPDNSRSGGASAKEKAVLSSPGEAENVQLKPSRETPRKKLCGYLNKLGIKGPIKTWKSRWFIYDENKCHLLYYRTAQDVNPLGSIDLSSASFDCKVENGEGVFEIRTPSRVFTLKAISKQAMMYWLQQLQVRRWEFCNAPSRFPVGSSQLVNEPLADRTNVVDSEAFMPPVKTPTEVVGLKAASLPAPQTSTALQNISLKHPWTEIQNTVYNICVSKQLRGNNGNIFNFSEFQENPESLDEEQEAEVEAGCAVKEEIPEDGRLESRMNWVRKAKWMNSGFLGLAEELSRERSSMDKVSVLQQQILTLTEEVKSQKELVKLLHKALEAAQQEKRVSSMYLTAAEDKDRLELVRHKVRQIADLTSRLEALEKEKKELEQMLALRDSHIQELKEHVQHLMEKNHAKQEVIMALTEQMARELSDPLQEANTITAETLYKQQEEIEHLKDDIDAYKTQNQFLNSEIHQVTRLWTSAAENEKALLMKCACLQARNCQMESKYLTVLRKLQETVPGLPSSDAELVRNLIQEALQWDVKEGAEEGLNLNPVSEYDEYGFMTVPDYEVEDWKLLAKIQALEIKSNNLRSQEVVEKPLRDRWNGVGELSPSAELKGLIRSGIPVEHRQRVWRWIVSRHCSRLPDHYQRLLRQSKSTEHPACRQIELDLPRTLTNNKYFSSPTSQLIPKLRRVLLAFSWHNPAIGYCQGLNRLAAVALLVLEDEESAFWCLVHIVENLMPADYYSDTLITSQVDQRVFKDFLAEKLPRLTAHFEQHQIDVSLITFNWFLVAFVDSLVSDILLRVWDAFLYEGTKVIFRYALAIFKYNEEEILRIHDNVEIYQYLRFFTRMIVDGRKLMNIAFNELNPFPMKLLRNRRTMHREELETELCELEQIKAAYVKERAEQGPQDLQDAVSEEEEEI